MASSPGDQEACQPGTSSSSTKNRPRRVFMVEGDLVLRRGHDGQFSYGHVAGKGRKVKGKVTVTTKPLLLKASSKKEQSPAPDEQPSGSKRPLENGTRPEGKKSKLVIDQTQNDNANGIKMVTFDYTSSNGTQEFEDVEFFSDYDNLVSQVMIDGETTIDVKDECECDDSFSSALPSEDSETSEQMTGEDADLTVARLLSKKLGVDPDDSQESNHFMEIQKIVKSMCEEPKISEKTVKEKVYVPVKFINGDLRVTMVELSDLYFIDRHLKDGETVKGVPLDSNGGECIGVVTSHRTKVWLKSTNSNVVLAAIDSSKLFKKDPILEEGATVMLDGWLGIVDEVKVSVVLQFDEGSSFCVCCPYQTLLRSLACGRSFRGIDLDEIDDVEMLRNWSSRNQYDSNAQLMHVIGQRVPVPLYLLRKFKAGYILSTRPESSKIVKLIKDTSKQSERLEATVKFFAITDVKVSWLSYTRLDQEKPTPIPDERFKLGTLDKLKVSKFFDAIPTLLQEVIYELQETDKQYPESMWKRHGKLLQPEHALNKEYLKPGTVVKANVLATESLYTVSWDNGTTEEVSAINLQQHLQKQEQKTSFSGAHWKQTMPLKAGDIVARKRSIECTLKYGIVKSVNAKEETCAVKWFRALKGNTEGENQVEGEEDEPMIDLVEHPTFSKLFTKNMRHGPPFSSFSKGFKVYVLNIGPGKTYSHGRVIASSKTDGMLLVNWSDGSVGKAWPQHLFRLQKLKKFFILDFPRRGATKYPWLFSPVPSISSFKKMGIRPETGEQSCSTSRSKGIKNFKAKLFSANVFPPAFNAPGTSDDDLPINLVLSEAASLFKSKYLTGLGPQESPQKSKDPPKDYYEFLDPEQIDPDCSLSHSSLYTQTSATATNMYRDKLRTAIDYLGKLETDFADPKEASLLLLYERLAEQLCLLGNIDTMFSIDFFNPYNFETEVVNNFYHHWENRQNLLWIELRQTIDDLEGLDDTIVDKLKSQCTAIKEAGLKFTRALIDQAKHICRYMEEADPNDALGSWIFKNGSSEIETEETKENAPNLVESLGSLNNIKGFKICKDAPSDHKYIKRSFKPKNLQDFLKAYRKEITILQSSLTEGIFIQSYEDRMDLLSIMIEGPANTPYEDALYFFDVQLSEDYPASPPFVHFVSFDSGNRLNPNLYNQGMVCISLLGTWKGQEKNEGWTSDSNLLQIVLSIRALILVNEPYYNEPGFDLQKDRGKSVKMSLEYNQAVLVKVISSVLNQIKRPPLAFKDQTLEFYKSRMVKLEERFEKIMQMDKDPDLVGKKPSEIFSITKKEIDYPLFPITKSFSMSASNYLKEIKKCIS